MADYLLQVFFSKKNPSPAKEKDFQTLTYRQIFFMR